MRFEPSGNSRATRSWIRPSLFRESPPIQPQELVVGLGAFGGPQQADRHQVHQQEMAPIVQGDHPFLDRLQDRFGAPAFTVQLVAQGSDEPHRQGPQEPGGQEGHRQGKEGSHTGLHGQIAAGTFDHESGHHPP